jgi:hypothetical protein
MKATEITGQVIYLGPRLHALGLGYAAIFRNGIHPALHAAIEQCPAIGQLMVPIKQASAVRRELDFDYGHQLRGTTGKYVTFYREVQNWLARQATQPKPSTINVKHHA